MVARHEDRAEEHVTQCQVLGRSASRAIHASRADPKLVLVLVLYGKDLLLDTTRRIDDLQRKESTDQRSIESGSLTKRPVLKCLRDRNLSGSSDVL